MRLLQYTQNVIMLEMPILCKWYEYCAGLLIISFMITVVNLKGNVFFFF